MEILFGYYPQLIMLVLARVMSVLWAFNFLGGSKLPMEFRACMGIIISVSMLATLPPEWTLRAGRIDSLPEMLFLMLNEIAIGMAVGMVCQIFIAACMMAGSIIGFSNSLMMAQSVDPTSGVSSIITSQILQLVFVMVFFLMNGHLVLVQLISKSFTTIPPGILIWEGDIPKYAVQLAAVIFEWGLKLAMPVMCAGLLIDVCLGLVSKLAPDFEIMMLSMPIRLFVGIALFGLIIRNSGDVMDTMINQMFHSINAILG